MSIMRRVRDVTVATLNDRLEQSQDPVRMIDAFLAQKLDAIRQTEKLVRDCAEHTQSLLHKYATAESMASKRETQAETAIKAGEDDFARTVLAEKVLEEEKRDAYRALYEQSRNALTELEEELNVLRGEYEEAYHKRQFYMAKMETLRLQKQLHDRSRGFAVQGDTLFQRLEDRINDLEYEMKALFEIRNRPDPSISRSSDEKVEEALAALKRKLEGDGR